MKKRETIAFNFDDIVKALNDVGIEVFPGKGKKDHIIAFDEDGNKHILGKDFNIFDDFQKPNTPIIDQYVCPDNIDENYIEGSDETNHTSTIKTDPSNIDTSKINVTHVICIAA